MDPAAKNPESEAFWEGVRRSAERTRGLPTWTQAGIVLSENFEGGVPRKPIVEARRDDEADLAHR
jgi:hypothetical protein